jgi:hypothetical protein
LEGAISRSILYIIQRGKRISRKRGAKPELDEITIFPNNFQLRGEFKVGHQALKRSVALLVAQFLCAWVEAFFKTYFSQQTGR